MRTKLHLVCLIVNAILGYRACFQIVTKETKPIGRVSLNWKRKHNYTIPVPTLLVF